MKSIFTKNIKLGFLYITILILLIEIIKIRPKRSSNNNNITENYENYENYDEKEHKTKLKKEIEDFSKQQKYLKIKQINFADSSYSKILYKNSPYLNSMNKVNLTARKFKI